MISIGFRGGGGGTSSLREIDETASVALLITDLTDDLRADAMREDLLSKNSRFATALADF
jgi:hypothetical protein